MPAAVSEDAVIRSGVRAGMKREFSFVTSSRSEQFNGRTRSANSPSPNLRPLQSTSGCSIPRRSGAVSRMKRDRSPEPADGGGDVEAAPSIKAESDAPAIGSPEPADGRGDVEAAPSIKAESDAPALVGSMIKRSPVDESIIVLALPCINACLDQNSRRHKGKHPVAGSNGAAEKDSAVPTPMRIDRSDAVEEGNMCVDRLANDRDGPKERGSLQKASVIHSANSSPMATVLDKSGRNTSLRLKPLRGKLNSSLNEQGLNVIMDEGWYSSRRVTRSLAKAIVTPGNNEIVNSDEENVGENAADGSPEIASLRPNPPAGKINLNGIEQDRKVIENEGGYPTRRVTRSASKVSATPGEKNIVSSVGDNVGDIAVNGSPEISPNKMELKMSKKIGLTNIPSNVKQLLRTGLLEGMSVKYVSSKHVGLRGVIKDGSILCFCDSCKGLKAISAFQFELHAGSAKKHPSDFIYLDNGKNLHDILKDCTNAPLDMVNAVIQNAIGPIPQSKLFVCQKCKESFCTRRVGSSAMFCNTCLQESNLSRKHSPRHETSNERVSSPAPASSSEASPRCILSDKKFGKLTRKNLGLHRLVFMDDILPNGTEVGYYARGQKMLNGLIQDGGIFCDCCKSVVSPSVFEAHAGSARRRKPYNNIYTSNGVSLHELSVSLSKNRKLLTSENDDLCSICSDGGDLLLCDLCPRAFHKECVGLSTIPNADYHCQYCQSLHHRDRAVAHNDNAIAAGRVSGVDPIEEIFNRCIRIVKKPEMDVGGCVFCRTHDFNNEKFGPRTVILCEQCEREYHIGCLKAHNIADLKELPEDEWFCCVECKMIYTHLKSLVHHEAEEIKDLQYNLIKKKLEEKGLNQGLITHMRWRLLSGNSTSSDAKLLLSNAVSIFHESFDPIVDMETGQDLIPPMVYGPACEQEYRGMYCAILMVDSLVVSAGILRVFGCEVAELPLVATRRESQGLGYFQTLFSCIERLLRFLHVKHFILPAAHEAESIWISKFGFSRLSNDQVSQYTKGAKPTVFQGTSFLHKSL